MEQVHTMEKNSGTAGKGSQRTWKVIKKGTRKVQNKCFQARNITTDIIQNIYASTDRLLVVNNTGKEFDGGMDQMRLRLKCMLVNKP